MATVPTQVRIDENLKKQASELFSQLGMDMSGAMNIFLKQCVLGAIRRQRKKLELI